MIKAVFDNLGQAKPKNHFTVGINDDVTHTSLPCDAEFSVESEKVTRAVFYGLGADGTVGANKNSIKIIGENTRNYAQGYYVYDSKKSGSTTVSHLRFGPDPIRSTYLVNKANFVACHQPVFLERYDMLKDAVPGGVFLLNTPYSPEELWSHLPRRMQRQIVDKKLRFTSSTRLRSPARAAWAGVSIQSCKPVSLRSQAYCRARMRSKRSRSRSQDLWQEG